MRRINVLFIREESGKCQQIFKDMSKKAYYCRIEGSGWYTVSSPDFETDCQVREAIFNICDAKGNVITNNTNYPFMNKFVVEKCKEVIENNKDYYEWKKYVLEDKDKFGYTDYDDNWLFYETKEISSEVEDTLNYLGQEIKVMKKCYEHNISKKRWIAFMAELDDINLKILGYSY